MSVAFTFNAANVAPSAPRDTVPSGEYDVAIVKSVDKETKDKNGAMFFAFDYKILTGDYAGKIVVDRINYKNANATTVEIAMAQLSAISHVTGVMQWTNTAQLHGKPFKVSVVKEERDDKPGSFSNNVTGYKDSKGNAPGEQGQVATGDQGASTFAAQAQAVQPDPAQVAQQQAAAQQVALAQQQAAQAAAAQQQTPPQLAAGVIAIGTGGFINTATGQPCDPMGNPIQQMAAAVQTGAPAATPDWAK